MRILPSRLLEAVAAAAKEEWRFLCENVWFYKRQTKLVKLMQVSKAELCPAAKFIHLFAREVLLVKKLEIEETKTT